MEEGFTRGHRVSRVLAVAIPVAMFLVWWSIWGTTADVISVTEVSGEVVRNDGRTCLVRAQSGESAHLLCPKRYMAGMKLRLSRTQFSSGDLRFALVPGKDKPAEPP
jgi:hypothetical protein